MRQAPSGTERITVEAPAKLNLFLEVVGRRNDGYHELHSLMCCIGLHDTLALEFGAGEETLTCGHTHVPEGEGNIAFKAMRVFHQALEREKAAQPLKIHIHLDKRIPVGAGLGGGSSDAAAVLKALNTYYGKPFERGRLLGMALGLGADVPFFMDGRPSLATGIGEKLTVYDGLPPMGVLLIYPGVFISTAEVFQRFNFQLTKAEKKIRYFPFTNGKFSPANHLFNDLEKVVADAFPVIRSLKTALLERGAQGASMTGSGSAVFGLFPDEAAARNALDHLDIKPGWQVFATQLMVEPVSRW